MTKSLSSVLRLEYNLKVGNGVFFQWCLNILKFPNSFMYFWNFRGTLMLTFWKYAKYKENLGLNKCQYCFANISLTKAQIFMKFDTYAQRILENYHKKFCKDLCTHGHAWRVFAHARDKTCAHRFTPRVRACVQGSLRNFLW